MHRDFFSVAKKLLIETAATHPTLTDLMRTKVGVLLQNGLAAITLGHNTSAAKGLHYFALLLLGGQRSSL